MKQRAGIKKLIINAWKKSIAKDYSNQRINSERSLQASFWSYLNKTLPDTQRIFIEPPFSFKVKGEVKVLYPDIVICNTKEVICVIELKYLPRGRPQYKKDIQSLALISKYRRQILIKNERFRGVEKDSKPYTLSDNVLFVWASIHDGSKSEVEHLYSHGYKSLDGCYLQLHAETEIGAKPKIVIVK